MRGGAFAVAFAALPAAVIASPYDGTYRQAENAECALVGADGGSIRVADGIFYGVEMECRMTQPVNVVDMDATLYTLQCSGEASQWAERVMMMKAADSDDLLMIWNGYAFKYARCPDQ